MTARSKIRADQLMVEQGLTESRSKAKALIMAGLVFAGDRRVDKAGENLPVEARLKLKEGRRTYSSRGGHKLEGALDDFNLDPADLYALDVGASTGGFTDCLLKRGAARVASVDVGQGLLDWRLREDHRVEVHEKLNARHLSAELVGGPFDAIVMDVSFISLTLIIPPASKLLVSGGWMLAMVKPQFEVGRELVGRGGVVRDPALQERAVEKIQTAAGEAGLISKGVKPSRLKGPKGNQEYFLLLTKN